MHQEVQQTLQSTACMNLKSFFVYIIFLCNSLTSRLYVCDANQTLPWFHIQSRGAIIQSQLVQELSSSVYSCYGIHTTCLHISKHQKAHILLFAQHIQTTWFLRKSSSRNMKLRPSFPLETKRVFRRFTTLVVVPYLIGVESLAAVFLLVSATVWKQYFPTPMILYSRYSLPRKFLESLKFLACYIYIYL